MPTNSLHIPEALSIYETEHLASRNLAPLTRQAYLSSLHELETFLTDVTHVTDVLSVDQRHLEGFLASLDSRGLSGNYRRRFVAAIRSFFAFLADREYITVDPSRRLVPPVREWHTPRVLTEVEYKRLRDTVRYEPRDAAIVELLLQTGVRLSEVSRLELTNVRIPAKITKDPQNAGSVTISGKGRKQRTITLNWKACKALSLYLSVRPRDTDDPRVFLTKFHSGISPRSIERAVEKYLTEAGIEGASVHTMRHTFGTHSVRRGTGLKVLQETLGHSSLDTTTIYVSLAREEMDRQLQENAL
jgi:site-specific recombinase XerD